MSLGLRRIDLQGFAQAKFDDAQLLLNNRRASNAYYLSGYAVELGLKACIARQVQRDTLPEKRFIETVYRQGHNLVSLVGLAGLTAQLKQEKAEKPAFDVNWSIVVQWLPDSRYQAIDIYSAQLMLEAIGNPEAGVLQWIRMYW